MTVKLRPGTQADAQLCGTICFEAFKAIGGEHNFPSGFPSPEFARRLLSRMLAHPQVYCVVAELDGRVVGSNFVDERSCIYGVGPITVDPAVQNGGIGRQLMEDVIGRATQRKACGMRLLQAGFHNRSLALYAKLGFRAREMVSVLQGAPLQQRVVGYEVRLATLVDVPACNRICHRVHGYDREVELREAIEGKTASVVEHLGHVTGYTTGIAQLAHTVGEANADLVALIGAAPEFGATGFLLPTRNHEVFTWCLNGGLKLVYQMTLMTMGLYNEPNGAYLPSILY